MSESVERVRDLLWKSIGAHGRALARRDHAGVMRADARIETLIDRLVSAARKEGTE